MTRPSGPVLVLALAALAATSCASHAARHAGPPASPIAEAVDAFFAALRAGDLATIDRFLADDYKMIGVSGALRDKASRLAWLRDNVHSISTVTPRELQIRRYGDLAVVTGLVVITDETPPIYERFTHVWASGAGGWRMVSGQVTAVAPANQPRN